MRTDMPFIAPQLEPDTGSVPSMPSPKQIQKREGKRKQHCRTKRKRPTDRGLRVHLLHERCPFTHPGVWRSEVCHFDEMPMTVCSFVVLHEVG